MAASLGGLLAYARILSALPRGFPVPILLIQHRSTPPNLLPQYFSRSSRLPVVNAREGDKLSPGCVYAAPPGRHLLVFPDRTLSLSDSEPVWFTRPSADRLFESAASVFRNRLLAVVLSGRGQDGANGVRAVHRAGGMVIAQSEKTCGAPGMPRHAIETGCVDMVLPLDKIASMLQRLAPPPGNSHVGQCAKPAYFFSPASTLRARRFWEGGSGQVAKAVKAQGGL
jgi:two-component system, chemotaxis family, protein-glutamate methylesterase/glutaminase